MRYHKNVGFSLIEIMIVIAIVGLLSAVAIPAYSSYIVKSRLASAITSLDFLKKVIIEDATMKGKVPDSVSAEIGTLATGTATPIKADPVTHIYYQKVSDEKFYLCASLKDLGVDEGTNPTSGNDGTKNRLCMFATRDTGVFSTNCGNLNTTDAQNIPEAFLPSGCNCKDVTTPAC